MKAEVAMLRGMAAMLEGLAAFAVANVQHDTSAQVQQIYASAGECWKMSEEIGGEDG